jgi:hypothetical protein
MPLCLFGALLIGLGLGIYVKIHGLTMIRNVTSAVSVRGADRFQLPAANRLQNRKTKARGNITALARYQAAGATPRATYAAQLATPPFHPD